MMSATHYFGDVDVICDIGGQDIKVLFMQNGDIENFRLSNQCSAGNGMLLQAMADQFGVKVTDYADVAFKAELSPKFSYGCAVFLDSRPRELPEGGLLQGRAARRPGAGAAEERLAVRRPDPAHGGARPQVRPAGRHAVQPGRASRRRSTTSRSASRAPRSTSTRTRGEAGAIGAAMETLPRGQAARATRPSSASTPPSPSSSTSTNDESTRCHFCPNQCARTFIDTKTPDGRTSPLHRGLLLREGHGRVAKTRCSRSSRSARS